VSLLLALPLAACATEPLAVQTQPASSADLALRDELAQFVQRFVAGYQSGDVEQMRPLYAPSAMIWAHNRPTAIGWPGIADFFAHSFAKYRAKVDAHVLDVERMAEGRVVLYTLARVDLEPKAPGSQPVTAYFRDVIILVRSAEGWQIETNVDQPTTRELFEADRARVPLRH
jgi:ketosteroid isomerase-like protein